MENEIWKDVIDYEGFYQVSSFGNIRSVERTIVDKLGRVRIFPQHIIRPSKVSRDKKYLITHLRKGGKMKSFLVHRIVATAFLGPVPNGMEVDHINGDGSDNRVCNIRYMSRFENASRSAKGVFRKQSNAMEHNPRAKAVVGYNNGVLFERLSCAKYLSIRYGVNYSTLRINLQKGGMKIGNTLYKYEDNS